MFNSGSVLRDAITTKSNIYIPSNKNILWSTPSLTPPGHSNQSHRHRPPIGDRAILSPCRLWSFWPCVQGGHTLSQHYLNVSSTLWTLSSVHRHWQCPTQLQQICPSPSPLEARGINSLHKSPSPPPRSQRDLPTD